MTENQSNCSESYGDYLMRASKACEEGDMVLGMHLYLAAYEKALADPDIPDGMALAGLHEAWRLACELKERSMAEYVFEKLEPYLTGEEIAECANELQNLALDRLEEYGFSREELQDMAEMISQDLMDSDSIVKVESISFPRMSMHISDEESKHSNEVAEEPQDESPHYEPTTAAKKNGESTKLGFGVAGADFNPYDTFDTSSVGKSYHAATNDGSGSYSFTRDADRAAASKEVRDYSAGEGGLEANETNNVTLQAPSEEASVQEQAVDVAPTREIERASKETALAESGEAPAMPDMPKVGEPALNYRSLAGYDEAISLMRDFGIGLQRDPGFTNFVNMMNVRHGLDRMPALDTMLFRSPAVEDATRFVDATVGEIGLPLLRMSMEEGVGGVPMLCVTTQGDRRPRMNHAHNRFDGPGILVIDDLDAWALPQVPDAPEGIAGLMMANISRGAREAMNLIRSAVEDPDVYVLVTASTQGEVDPFFYELFEPLTVVDIANPTEDEREDIWREIARNHPSMRSVGRADFLRFSAGLPRYDIYMAARAAIEEAYKTGLVERMYVPVSLQNLLDKFAACQPLDSEEYKAIEDAVVSSFRNELDDLENLIDGPAEAR